MPQHAYGWRGPSLPDQRDFSIDRMQLTAPPVLPPRVDLRSLMPPIEDQGPLGSCTSFGIGAAVRYERRRQNLPDFTPSHLALYYAERALERSTRSDSGAQIRDGLRVVNKTGVAPESMWPYLPSKFAVKPPANVYAEAKKHLTTGYYACPQDATAMMTALANQLPIVVGFTCYESLESPQTAATGDVPMPGPHEAVIGGHCVLCCGYDQPNQKWIFRNSWSAGWGQAGYGTLPWQYLLSSQLAGDFWVVQTEAA